MKKDILKYFIIVLLLVTIILIIKTKNNVVYVENETEHICQKCTLIDGGYYCQIYGIEGGDK